MLSSLCWRWLFGLFLVAATIIAYHPAWNGGFIWDDDKYVTKNPLLFAPDGLRQIWFSIKSPSQYFPLTYTVFRFEWELWGLNPTGYHWVNILMHAANALLVWRLLYRLRVPGAWLAAAIFALHPVQVEAVAWISELKSILSLFFILLALLAWVKFIEERPGRWWLYLLSLFLYVLALFSKTTACTLPVVLLLILWLQRKPISRYRLVQVVPFVVLGLAMGLLAMWWERYHQDTQGKLFAFSLLDRFLIASHAAWFYIGKLVWPHNLTFSYPRWNINPANPLEYAWLIAGIGLGGGILFARRRLGRGLEVATLFYLATLAPTLGFIMLYTFRYSFVADHYQYVACIGPFALAAAAITRALKLHGDQKAGSVASLPAGRTLPLPGLALCGGLLLVLGILTWRQCGMYANQEILWRVTLDRNPASWMADNNLGVVLFEKGELAEAMVYFQRALQMHPDFAEAHNNLGNALFQKGRVDEAIAQYQKALQINPDYAEAHDSLGTALLQMGKVDEAIAQDQKALQIHPDSAKIHNNLGNALLQKGKVNEAIAHFQKALEINPDLAEVHNNLGAALFQKGLVSEAIVQYQKALQINPGFLEACYDLGNAFRKEGNLDKAIIYYQRALQINPHFAGVCYFLGNAFRKQGRLEEAITSYRKALQIKPDYVEAQNNLAWVLATCPQASLRNGKQAVALAQQANQLTGDKNPVVLGTLAAAYAEIGRFPEAVKTAQHALQLARTQSNSAMADAIQSQLMLYQAGLPFRSR